MSERTARYLIDTSVFIQAYRAYYSFRLCPGFWQSMVSLHNRGLVFSIDRVLDEICFGEEDELTVWSKKQFQNISLRIQARKMLSTGLGLSKYGLTHSLNFSRRQRRRLQTKQMLGLWPTQAPRTLPSSRKRCIAQTLNGKFQFQMFAEQEIFKFRPLTYLPCSPGSMFNSGSMRTKVEIRTLPWPSGLRGFDPLHLRQAWGFSGGR